MNTKESGFEDIIVNYLVQKNGYALGSNEDYNKEYAIDEKCLFDFLQATQINELQKLGLSAQSDEYKKDKFFKRITDEIKKRGIVDVLRTGVKDYPAEFTLFYLTPHPNNAKAVENFNKNIFSVTRQLRYSSDNTKLALDLCVFINGLPVITFELKNQFTKQNVLHAVEQYKTDRDSRELLFSFKRCMVHFAVDDANIKFCTQLNSKSSWFLPFDKGFNDGAGNPPNPNGIKTDYLWHCVLTKQMLTRIIESYAKLTIEVDEETKKKTEKMIFPRYHQLDVVEKLVQNVQNSDFGKRYLIQHSAGSGKSNSITWLSLRLVNLQKDGHPLFDSIFVVTDRKNLDSQTSKNAKLFAEVQNLVTHVNSAEELHKAIDNAKRIIITTIEKFPFVVKALDSNIKDKKFALIIDEAHSGQTGQNAAQMNTILSGNAENEEISDEDYINKIIEGRKLLTNAFYFAFTATPKNKTLELFGTPYTDSNGNKKFNAFHNYTMKQAIQEGFILDVLEHFTPIDTFYKIKKTIEDDPTFDKNKSQKKLRTFVESDSYTIQKKSEIIVEHFLNQVIAKRKINGQARAMVVTASIARCIDYYSAISKCLKNSNSPYKAIIAFSGEKNGVTCSKLNGFSDKEIPAKLKQDPYRILIVADMFQTGFDEPLLHTMYVDKILSDIKAVQTLSRLNRCCPYKNDTCILDFANSAEDIQKSFEPYYRKTILNGETDVNKLNDLVDVLKKHNIFADETVEDFVHKFLSDKLREVLDPILDECVVVYKELPEDDQVEFKSAAKAFCRTYSFLAAILPVNKIEWEKLSIFLTYLIPKLPAPKTEDLTQGLLQTVDLESYRNTKKQEISISLADKDSEIEPVPAGKSGHLVNPELDKLSNIVKQFNDLFGNIKWEQPDNVLRQIKELPKMVLQDEHYQNAIKHSDEQNARIESDSALRKVMFSIMSDNIELFKQFMDNPMFRKWLCETVFNETYTKKSIEYKIKDSALQVAEN